MRLRDIHQPNIILEGIKYGAKEQAEVLKRLDEFRFGIEVEMQVTEREIRRDELEYYEVRRDINVDTIVDRAGIDKEGFLNEFARNLWDELGEQVPEVVEYIDNSMDDFFLWLLDNASTIREYADADDPDVAYNKLKGIVDKQRELSSDTFDEFYQTYLDGLRLAFRTTRILSSNLNVELLIDDMKEFFEELHDYIDDEHLMNVDQLDVDDLEDITGTVGLREFASIMADAIEDHNDRLDRIGMDATIYRHSFHAVYERFLKSLGEMDTFGDIYEKFLIPEYTDIHRFAQEVIPLSDDQTYLVYDFEADTLYDDVDEIIDTLEGLIDDQDYHTTFKLVGEHDHQVEVFSDGVITGESIVTAWQETWELVDTMKRSMGMRSASMSGVHISISMPEAKGQKPDLMKFIVVSNILNLIPEDARNIRRHVRDIRQNYSDDKNIGRLVSRVWQRVNQNEQYSKAYLAELEKWLNENTYSKGTKFQTVNFGKMDTENGRIEIRMYGGEDYEEREGEIWDTLIRSMYALIVAYDPSFKRNAYLKTVDKMVQGIVKDKTGFELNEFILRLKKLHTFYQLDTSQDWGSVLDAVIEAGTLLMLPIDDKNLARVRRERGSVNESKIVQLKESKLRMKQLVDVKIGMEDADFYIKRRGSLETVGKPSKSYDEYAIGIKVKDSGLLHPDYLYYWFEHLYNTGYWKSVAKGTTNLVNITMDDLRNIEFR